MSELSKIFEKITVDQASSHVDLVVIDVVGTLVDNAGRELNKDLENFYHYLRTQSKDVFIGSSDASYAKTLLSKAGARIETINAVNNKHDILAAAFMDKKNIILIDDQPLRRTISVDPHGVQLRALIREFLPTVQ